MRALTMAAGCTVSIQPDDDDADVELDVDFDRRRDRAPDSAPAALTGASFPARDRRIAGDHLHGHMPADLPSQPFGDPAHLIDDAVQMLDQTGGAGALRSTAPDLSRFFDARISGALVPAPLLAEMRETVPVDDESAALGTTGYGLGLERWDVGRGTVYGHGGSTRGFTTLTTVRPGAHDITVMVAAQDPLPLTAYGPTLPALAPASVATDRGGDTATQSAESDCSGGAVADQNAPGLSKS